MKKTILTFAALLALTGTAQAADLTVPHTFSPGTPIKSSDMNDNFSLHNSKINDLLILLNAIKNPGSQHVDNGNGTVTDKLTGLTWLKNANCFGQKAWLDANTSVAALASGQCGLTDNSVAGAWRLPNMKELMMFFEYTWPLLTNSHPYANVVEGYYWTTSELGPTNTQVWDINTKANFVYRDDKTWSGGYIWPIKFP